MCCIPAEFHAVSQAPALAVILTSLRYVVGHLARWQNHSIAGARYGNPVNVNASP